MKSRLNHWTIIATLFASVALVQVSAPAASAAPSNTTTTIAVSDTSPSIGDTVTFTVTVTPATFSTVITGNVVVSAKGDDNNGLHELCATSNLVENPSTHVVTGTCSWKTTSAHDGIKADYKGNVLNNSGYNNSRSSELPTFKAVGVTQLWIPRMAVGSSGTLKAWANTAGDVAFKVDGQVISSCGNKAVTGSGTDWSATCSYSLPTPTTAYEATHIFSTDFTPTGKSKVIDQFTKPFTPDAYYLPSGDNIFQSTVAGFNHASSKAPYVNAGYIEIDHIFYKLNRSTMEAMAVGYDRFAGLTKLNFPDVLNVSSAAVPGKSEFAGAYSITAIGAWAFWLTEGDTYTHALLKEVSFPSTLKVIGENSLVGQCGITNLDIPDSVLYIGPNAFGAMNTTGKVNNQGYAGCTGGATSTGLVNIKFGAGLTAIGPGVFVGDGSIKTLSFRGAPSDLKALVQSFQIALDMWQITAETQNQNMYAFTNLTKNSCLGNISYAGTLQVDVLAAQSTAWRYWAQGCLTGTLTVQATIFKPSQPAAPVLSNATYTSLAVNFTAPISDGGDTITAYSVEYSSNNFATWETATSTLTSASAQYVINNLTPSTAYRVRVKARNSVGTSLASQVSAPLITQTPTAPGAPTAVSVALATNTSVTLAYTAPGSNGGATIESYTAISTPDSVVAYSSGSGNGNVTLTGLRPGITYSFSLRAGNSAGRSLASNSLTLKIPKSPVLGTWPNISKSKSDAPFLLTPPSESYTAAGSFVYTSSNPGIVSISGETVTVVQSGSAVITATFYPSDTATYLSGVTKTMTISVSAALNSITFGSISSRALTSGKFNLAATALGGTVTYATSSSASICTVTNGGAVSMFSPGTCAITASTLGNANYGAATDVTQNLIITAAPPAAPTLTSVSVGGTDASTATSGYATLQFTANTENGGSITSYTLTATPATGSVITKTVNGAAGTRTESITALSLGVAYTFSVTAYNGGTAGGGTSVASNSVSKTPAANPNAPTNLRVTSGNTTLTANWTPPASLGGGSWDSYRIFIKRSSDSSFPDTPTAVVETQTASSYIFTGLTNGVAYDIKIWVKTTSFTTELLANTAAVYLIPATVPSAPRIALAQTDSVTVSASWASNGDGGSALTGYSLTLSSGACSFSFVSGTTSYSCAISGLTPGVTVTASLVASNQIGASTASTTNINYVTVVGAPTSVVVTNGDGLASLAFSIDNGGDTIVSFDYSIDNLSYLPLNVTSSPITITGLTNDQTYDIYLRAKGATFGNGASSSAIRVVPRLTVITVTQTVATPSYLKAVTYPFISATGTSYICSRGEYQFVRSGGGIEAAKITNMTYQLFINGTLVDSATSMALTVSFERKEVLETSTISCSVIIEQEGLVSEFESLDNPIYIGIAKAKYDSLKVATGIFQDARDAAYALRVEGNAASILAWRKSMDIALEVLSNAKDIATSIYVDALEKEGISIFTAAPVVKTPVVPIEVKEPVVPIEVKEPGTSNVQPTKIMRKVGTIYFATGTSFINDASRKTIEKLAIQIKSSGAKLVLSYGHTDSQGGVNNTLLSRSRSIAIAQVLRKLLPGVKISTGWFASTKPIATGKSASDLAKNRRVEIYTK